jgi:hypothetical protein
LLYSTHFKTFRLTESATVSEDAILRCSDHSINEAFYPNSQPSWPISCSAASRIPTFFMTRLLFLATAICFLSACATTQPPFHGFTDQASLNKQDALVIQQSSIGNVLDPMNLAQDDQRYNHDNIAYNRIEEGYYQWGQKLYAMGYRDEFYVRDLAPKALHHELMDTYDHAIAKGFEDAKAKP